MQHSGQSMCFLHVVSLWTHAEYPVSHDCLNGGFCSTIYVLYEDISS